MKIISSRVHGLIDYAAAVGLIVIPFVLGFKGIPLILSVAGGTGLVLYSLITDYALSAAKMLTMRQHLFIDGLAALAFLVAPFVMGWTGIVQLYYVVMGGAIAAVVLLTQADKPETIVTSASTAIDQA